MPAGTAAAPLPERFGRLVSAFSRRPGVTAGAGRRGFGADALQLEGRIFAMARRGGLVLKLPAGRVAALVEGGRGRPFDAGKGRPLRQWVVLERGSDAEWQALAEEALAFAAGSVQGASRSRAPGC